MPRLWPRCRLEPRTCGSVLQASYPFDADTWEIAVVATANIDSAARSFLVTHYVICT